MKKTARIRITHHTDTVVSFKVRKERKDRRYIFDKYWEDKFSWNTYGINCMLGNVYTPTKACTPPKLRKEQFYDHEYAWYSSEPKWWRKVHHIRPLRRANKALARKMSQLPSLEIDYNPLGGFYTVVSHPYYNAPEPLYRKPHIYYW